MRNCLTIKEALEIAEFTGEEVCIKLKSGTEFNGVVEKICGCAFRLWVNPEDLCCPNGSITKAWIPINAVKSVKFDEESVVFDCNHDRCDHDNCNHDKCDHDKCNQDRCDHDKCNHDNCDHDRCNHDKCNHDNCNRHNNEKIAQGIREALNAACLTGQIVTVGLICHGEPKTLIGRIIKVTNNTFCIKLEECKNVKEEKIEDIEYIKF